MVFLKRALQPDRLASLGCVSLLSLSACSAYRQTDGSDVNIANSDSAEANDISLVLPSTVSISSGYSCTGILVGQNEVLTASHCFNHQRPSGSVGFGPRKGSAGRCQIDRDVFFQNQAADIMRLRIHCPSGLPAGFRPAPVLHPNQLAVGDEVIAAGFGTTLSTSEAGAAARVVGNEKLMKVTGVVKGVGSKITVEFANFRSSLRGVCSGDSGGPLYVVKNGRLHVVGVDPEGDRATSHVLSTNGGLCTSRAFYFPAANVPALPGGSTAQTPTQTQAQQQPVLTLPGQIPSGQTLPNKIVPPQRQQHVLFPDILPRPNPGGVASCSQSRGICAVVDTRTNRTTHCSDQVAACSCETHARRAHAGQMVYWEPHQGSTGFVTCASYRGQPAGRDAPRTSEPSTHRNRNVETYRKRLDR